MYDIDHLKINYVFALAISREIAVIDGTAVSMISFFFQTHLSISNFRPKLDKKSLSVPHL